MRRWHAKLHAEASPDTAAKAYRLLRAVCNTAVEVSVLAVNPCQVKGAGVEHHAERPTATVAEVVALADAVPERFRMLVQLATWTSLRFGEPRRAPRWTGRGGARCGARPAQPSDAMT